MRSICVFCGSKPGANDGYMALATEVGTLLARRGIAIVYGGGRVGLMGALADAALAASIFHFKEIEIPHLKKYLKEHGIAVRI